MGESRRSLADRSSSKVQCSDGKTYEIASNLLSINPITVTEHGEFCTGAAHSSPRIHSQCH